MIRKIWLKYVLRGRVPEFEALGWKRTPTSCFVYHDNCGVTMEWEGEGSPPMPEGSK